MAPRAIEGLAKPAVILMALVVTNEVSYFRHPTVWVNAHDRVAERFLFDQMF